MWCSLYSLRGHCFNIGLDKNNCPVSVFASVEAIVKILLLVLGLVTGDFVGYDALFPQRY